MNRFRSLQLLVAAVWLLPAGASAQTVLVRVLTGDAGMPVFGALAYLVDPAGNTVTNGLTDERGRALFAEIPAASYRIRVEMIGMATVETDLFEVGEGLTVSQDLRLETSAIQLEAIQVEAEGGRCRVRPGGEGMAVAEVWDEARKALSAAQFTDQQGAYRYETMMYNRRLTRDFTILSDEQSRREGYMLSPFESRPAEDLVSNGFVQSDGRDQLYYAPDASVLLSDAFLDTHCFRLARGGDETEGFIGLGFEPTGDNKRVADIRGTMWLDASTAELQWLEYTYEYLDPDISSSAVGGRVDFERMPAGTWIVPEWWIRMPVVAQSTDRLGRPTRFVSGYAQSGGMVVEVREAGGRSLGQRIETGGFEGVVVDSLGSPRRAVRVSVVGSNQEVFSNGEGRYSITGLRPGRYQVRFVDPALEVFGFVGPAVARDVIRGEMTTLDHHMPSVGDVLFEACRDEPRFSDSVVLAGMVLDSDHRPVADATVAVRWEEYDLRSPQGIVTVEGIRTDGFTTTTDEQGFYRFCGVPVDVRLNVSGTQGDLRSVIYELRSSPDAGAILQPIELGRE